MLENTDRSIKKEDPVKLTTFGTEDTRWRQEQKLLKKQQPKKPTPYALVTTVCKETQNQCRISL